MKSNLISIVIPVFNGEKTIGPLIKQLIDKLNSLCSFEIILINDCSVDNSEEKCINLFNKYPKIIKFYSLAKNVGEHTSVMAGLNHAEGDFVLIRLPSGETRRLLVNCSATIGQVSNLDHKNASLGKAGRKRHLGIRPRVRGSAMTPRDHPHGGGEGRSPIGLPSPKTPWGKPTLGYKTRKKNKSSDKFIVQRRK